MLQCPRQVLACHLAPEKRIRHNRVHTDFDEVVARMLAVIRHYFQLHITLAEIDFGSLVVNIIDFLDAAILFRGKNSHRFALIVG